MPVQEPVRNRSGMRYHSIPILFMPLDQPVDEPRADSRVREAIAGQTWAASCSYA